jgi:hypothetical protein
MTTFQTYLQDPNVSDFLDWLVGSAGCGRGAIDTLSVDMQIRPSGKVPGGVKARFTGLESATSHYKWNGKDWPQTRSKLAALSSALRGALSRKDDTDTVNQCDEILKWGGNRSTRKGAYPFIHGLKQPAHYISTAADELALRTADLSKLGSIRHMNSMLTKVHALASVDGLPIYDSRVAVAISTIVEIYRSCSPAATARLAASLTFPSVANERDVTTLFRGVASHGSVATRDEEATKRWTDAKVRLGWILLAVLQRRPDLFAEPESTGHGGGTVSRDRMHALEAALFMVGYDARCLSANFCRGQVAGMAPDTRAALVAVGAPQITDKSPQIRTLVRANEFRYEGDIERGVTVAVSRQATILVSAEFIHDICEEFEGQGWIDCSFSRGEDGTTQPAEGSFSRFITDRSESGTGRQLTSQHAPRIAAVLVDLGLCEYRRHERRAQLNFDIVAAKLTGPGSISCQK